MIALIFGLFLVLLFSGIAIYLALGVSAIIAWHEEGIPLVAFSQFFADHLNTPTFVAVPMFVIAATFMERGRISQVLVDFALSIFGSLRGALAYVCIAATALFAAISGSSVATALAMGKSLIPQMRARGYPDSFTTGTLGAAATLGILIPPSLPMIIYALVVEESVPRLFLAGVVPGLIQVALFLMYVWWRGRTFPSEGAFDPAAVRRASARAVPGLTMPLVVFGGIYSGLLTVNEAASAAAAMAIVISWLFYRAVSTSEIPFLLSDSFRETAKIMVIILAALGLAHWLIGQGVARALADYLNNSGLSAVQILLISNVIMLFLGMFLEVISVILIFVPLIVLTLETVGIDNVHFGIVVIINMELALLTPPIGLNLFVLAGISGVPVKDVMRGCIPYVIMMAGLLILVTLVPEISLFLPNLVYGD
ncbi:TRAP transporter large permease [Notoacmeibacter marinus]|uniref:TRAP transporter large permease n=1 Tax=Notoacmeibacter marinus TaxID=1876515 RepID=UPI000DF2A0D0|nr:TRAP transporter large permease [Notoacmeibacter marinus]